MEILSGKLKQKSCRISTILFTGYPRGYPQIGLFSSNREIKIIEVHLDLIKRMLQDINDIDDYNKNLAE